MPCVLPDLSIVTPSFNQGRFLKANILSIRQQNYPSIEHILIDGGSTDETMDIAEKHRGDFYKIVSEKDEGQYHAINKGFSYSNGEIMAWLNSDDMYLPGALSTVGAIFAKFPEIEWLTTRMPAVIAEGGPLIKVTPVYGFTQSGFLRGDNLPGLGWPAVCFIQQESTFWRRSLWERAGGHLDTTFRMAGDFDLWARFFQHAPLYSVDVPLGCFRRHSSQKTSSAYASYLEEAKTIFVKAGGQSANGALQSGRIWLRQSLPPQLRSWAITRHLIQPAPTVTYDWGSEEWVLERR